MKISTNWLKDFVTLPPPLESVAERLTMAGLEVKKMEADPHTKDVLFEIEITTNRPDWLSHLGVAREIAAVDNVSLKMPPVEPAANRPMPSGWKIHLKEAEGCPYYTAVYMEGITAAPTPDFIRDRLGACGIRPIHLIVDITNYVLLETGQPLHAFDADLLRAEEIQIRRAKAGEPFLAISEAKLTLQSEDLVIADGERAVALAGIMGGKESAINERTRNLLLESAYFLPRWIRQTSRKYALASESSYRFERRVDPEGVDFGRERAVALIKQYAKPRFLSAAIKAGQKPVPVRGRIHLSLSEIEKTLGFKMKAHEVASILTRLNRDVKQDSPESWSFGVPSFRQDLTQPVDLIEEVARLHGYENIPESLPSRPLAGASESLQWKLEQETRDFFRGAGLCEAVTFSLISNKGLDADHDLKEAVRVINPLNQELNIMRPTLLPSLLDVIQKNANAGASSVPLFEVASVYRQGGKQTYPEEERSLGIALFGKWKSKTWLDPEREATFYDLKGLLESYLEMLGVEKISFAAVQKSYLLAPGAEKILAGTEGIGYLGEVHPRLARLWDLDSPVYFAQIALAKLVSLLKNKKTFHELPRFPSIQRDLAIVVSDDLKAGEIEMEILRLGGDLLCGVALFDLFSGGRIPKGFKNLAFRLTYQSREKTLVAADIQKIHSEIADAIAKKFQASFQ